DLADPSEWPSLLARIEHARSSGRKSPRVVAELDRVRGHQAEIREGRGTEGNWTAIIEALDGLVAVGLPPSHREIRDLLLPIIDRLPDDEELPHGFRLILREIDRYLATRPSPPLTPPVNEPG